MVRSALVALLEETFGVNASDVNMTLVGIDDRRRLSLGSPAAVLGESLPPPVFLGNSRSLAHRPVHVWTATYTVHVPGARMESLPAAAAGNSAAFEAVLLHKLVAVGAVEEELSESFAVLTLSAPTLLRISAAMALDDADPSAGTAGAGRSAAPQLLGAALTRSLADLILSFDGTVQVPLLGSEESACGGIFPTEVLAAFGASPSCAWSPDGSLLRVVLGNGATLKPGDAVTILAGALGRAGAEPSAAQSAVVASYQEPAESKASPPPTAAVATELRQDEAAAAPSPALAEGRGALSIAFIVVVAFTFLLSAVVVAAWRGTVRRSKSRLSQAPGARQ